MEPPGGSTEHVVPHRSNMPHANTESTLRWSKRRSVQRHLRLITRLARMSPKELGQRVASNLSKRLGIPANLPAPQTSSTDFARSMQSHGSLLKDFLIEQFDRSFFFGPSSRFEIAAAIRSAIRNADIKICKLADSIDSAGLPYLGQKVKIVAGEIDWQADPKSGKRCWTTGVLDEADAISCKTADVKFVWEFNRHQFLPILGRAYWLSGEERYAHQAVALIDDWIKNNPVGLGVNWCSHLEVAMRSISWLWTMPLILALPNLDEAFLNRWLSSIEAHYHHLRRNLSIYTDPTNHLIGEATALWMLCLCFPSLPEAERDAQRALLILTREVKRQITPDGVNCEQATNYHRFVLDFYLQILILAKRNEITLTSMVSRQVEAMIEFVDALAGESGIAPMIGDSDDARGMPFLELVGWNFRDTLSTGSILFERGKWKAWAGSLAEASIWLLGANAPAKFESLQQVYKEKRNAIFPHGGYYFLRGQSNENRSELIFDAGSLGLWPNAAHGHADALSILIRLNGKLILTDPGTGAYFGGEHERNYFRSTAAHNTITVDDLDQADLYDTFKWVNPMNVKLNEYCAEKDFTYVSAVHDGFRRLRAGVTHTREVLAIGTAGWVVHDQIDGKGNHLVKQHFNFTSGIELTQLGEHSVLAWDPISEHGLRFDFPSAANVKHRHIVTSEMGLWSGEYGRVETVPHLTAEIHIANSSALMTFITPIFGGAARKNAAIENSLNVQTIAHQGSHVYKRCLGNGNALRAETILINPSRQMISLSSELNCNSRFAYIQKDSNAVIANAFIVGKGSRLVSKNLSLQCDPNERTARYSKDIQ